MNIARCKDRPNSEPAAGRCPARRGLTLVELLVVMVIIAMLAGIALGALQKTRESARRVRTQATIAKINDILMQKCESYATRRLPLSMRDGSGNLLPASTSAQIRVYALRDLMRMEMPERYKDISTGPLPLPFLPNGRNQLPQPAMQRLYQQKMTGQPADHEHAKCLYMVVMAINADARSMFGADEIAPNLDGDKLPVFIDGWGNPIAYLRWAPGFTPWSDIQIDDTTTTDLHHDPLDPRGLQKNAYHLIPLVFSGVIGKDSNGRDDYGISGLSPAENVAPTFDHYTNNATVGAVRNGMPIHNHHMEQR